MKSKGFTLIEVIGIIVIIGLIIAIIAPTAIRITENSRRNTFRESMRSIIRRAEVCVEEKGENMFPIDLAGTVDPACISLIYSEGFTGIVSFDSDREEIFLTNIVDDSERFCGNGTSQDLEIIRFPCE